MRWVSLVRAAEATNYSHKYIAQLATKKAIVGTRRSHGWLIDLDSVVDYFAKRDEFGVDTSRGHALKRFPDKRVRCVYCMELLMNIRASGDTCAPN